jgi:hypothetical protein
MAAEAPSMPPGLELLRKEFPTDQIHKLPRITCPDCSKRRCDKHSPRECKECGNWITPRHIHLDYVGHAELTARLLDADPGWTWEPLAFDEAGLPKRDEFGGLWIRLTVCGITRLGYGDAQGKTGPNAIKEIIGDALRNAAMRFGAALDLWAKSDLRGDDTGEESQEAPEQPAPAQQRQEPPARPQWKPPRPCANAQEYPAWAQAMKTAYRKAPTMAALEALRALLKKAKADGFLKDGDREQFLIDDQTRAAEIADLDRAAQDHRKSA